jgi:3'-phosphoadenosine 5'-phosphosulfate sulfotransferase (PAPS reductase)/FAD synthetase
MIITVIIVCRMVPDLRSYDVILVNSSAGKDSQAMLDYLVELTTAAGVRDRLVVVHCDLGDVEWAGARELAAEQAAHYGVRFEVVRRPQGLLEQVAARGMWPDSQNRYCTSDHKRDQVTPLITRLAAERRAAGHRGQVRILNCQGIRAAESSKRAKKTPFTVDRRTTTGRKHVDLWYPIFTWATDTVWARILQSGVRHHFAYDLGMPRLSCCFCVFAPPDALLLAGQHNPALLDRYVAVEAAIGHTFKRDLSIASIRAAIRTGAPAVQTVGEWCDAA